ncbi:hypothetical protein Tco_1339426 [Tanacetum coccineum]
MTFNFNPFSPSSSSPPTQLPILKQPSNQLLDLEIVLSINMNHLENAFGSLGFQSLGLMGSSSNKKSGDGADTNTMVIDDVDDISFDESVLNYESDDVDDISFDESVLNYESDDVARKMDSGVGNIGGYRKGKRKGFPAKNLMAERRRRKKMNDLCERYGQLQRKWGKKTLTRPNPIPVTTTNKHVLMDVQRQPRWPLQESFSGKMAHVELEMSTSKLRLKNVVTYDHYGESDDDIEYGGGYIGEYGYVDDDSDF